MGALMRFPYQRRRPGREFKRPYVIVTTLDDGAPIVYCPPAPWLTDGDHALAVEVADLLKTDLVSP